MGRVRLATFTEVQEIVDFLERYHLTSNLSDIPFDRNSMRQSVNYHIGMKQHVCYVYDDEGVAGVLMGSVEPFMFNQKRKWATDTLFIADKGGAQLLKQFHKWAKHYNVDRIVQGVSSGNQRADDLYEILGMERVGGMYVIR